MKKLSLAIGIGAIAFLAYKATSEPVLKIISYDHLKKEGMFSFGGNQNSFSAGMGGSATAGSYTLTYKSEDGKTIMFDLYKNGQFIKRLKTL